MTTVLLQRPEMFPHYLINDMTAKPSSWSPETWSLPAVSGDAQSNFSSFLFRDVRRAIKKERSVDNGEPVKPHLDWLSFSPTSFPHSMPACWLGNAGQGLPAFPFSAGEDFPLQRLSSGPATSGGHAWGNGWETPKQLKTISGGDLSLLVSWKWWWGGLRMQGITWFVVLSKSIKPHGWDLTIYHILVHLISNGNEK